MKAFELSQPHGYLLLGCLSLVYDNALASDRLGQGFACHTPRRLRLEHEALAHAFKDCDIRVRDAAQLHWGGIILRFSKISLAAVVVDHPQLDTFAVSGG